MDTKQGEEIRTLSGNENASNFIEAEKEVDKISLPALPVLLHDMRQVPVFLQKYNAD